MTYTKFIFNSPLIKKFEFFVHNFFYNILNIFIKKIIQKIKNTVTIKNVS